MFTLSLFFFAFFVFFVFFAFFAFFATFAAFFAAFAAFLLFALLFLVRGLATGRNNSCAGVIFCGITTATVGINSGGRHSITNSIRDIKICSLFFALAKLHHIRGRLLFLHSHLILSPFCILLGRSLTGVA